MTYTDFFKTYGGKLAAAASAVGGILTYIATDPTAAILLSDFLPEPLRILAIIGIAVCAYILPLRAIKKDEKTDG